MQFKDWLMLEFDASDFFYGLQLRPSDAFDFEPSSRDPQEHSLLQKRWKTEAELGRKMHNIDHKEFQSRGYTSIQSKTLPDAGPGHWKHKPDNGSGSVEIVRLSDLNNIRFGKNSKDLGSLKGKGNPGLNINLRQLFGDDPHAPESLSKNFDKPWREDVGPAADVSGQRGSNVGMGVSSRLVGPDETGEKERSPVPVADFGFDPNKRTKKHKYLTTLWRKFNV